MKHGGKRTGAGGQKPRLKQPRKKMLSTRVDVELLDALEELSKQGYVKAQLVAKGLKLIFAECGVKK